MIPYRIMGRADTAAGWAAANPVLALGERGYESDTGKEKIGDGAVDNQGNVTGTAWNALPYADAGKETQVGAMTKAIAMAVALG